MTIDTVEEDGITVATMDDGKVNALSFEAIEGLRAALAEAVGRAQPLVIEGRDGCFSAGFDLKVVNSGDEGRNAIFAKGAELYGEIIEAPVPVVASCTGHALAGGALLLLSADHRIGRSGPYRIGLNEVGIGLALPAFAVVIATHRLDGRSLTAATMFAEVAVPERALGMGYLDDLVDDPVTIARSYARSLAELQHEAFADTKRRVRHGLARELAALA